MRVLSALVLASVLLAGCDGVFGLTAIPTEADAAPSDLGCASRTALLCADFEQGTTYYANGIASDLTMATGNVAAGVDTPGANSAHAVYVDSTGDAYRFEGRSTAPTTRITATFDIELSRFEAGTAAMALAVLYFDPTAAPECYVALDYQPTPMRLTFVESCTSFVSRDLAIPLPSHALFVPVTIEVDLAAGTGSAQLGGNTATVAIDPAGTTSAPPGVAFGLIDAPGSAGARVGFDNLLVVTAP